MAEDREAISDETLVGEYARDPEGEGGRAALAILVERWSGRVYVWAYRLVRERELALDLAQNCLVRMIQALPRYQARGQFAAWLFTIVRNRCRSAMRRSTWVRDPEIEVDLLSSDGAGPEASYEVAETQRRVLDAMDEALDARERLALWLRAGEGMSVEDITRLMEIDSASGARGLLQTARRKLRAALAPLDPDQEGRS